MSKIPITSASPFNFYLSILQFSTTKGKILKFGVTHTQLCRRRIRPCRDHGCCCCCNRGGGSDTAGCQGGSPRRRRRSSSDRAHPESVQRPEADGPDGQRAGLVGSAELHGHVVDERHDAKRNLPGDTEAEAADGKLGARADDRPQRRIHVCAGDKGSNGTGGGIGEVAVVELDRGRVLEQVAESGLEAVVPNLLRNDALGVERPVVVGPARVIASDKGARNELRGKRIEAEGAGKK